VNTLNFRLIPIKENSQEYIDIIREIRKGEQEYVTVGFKGHKHLPIVFRIHLWKESIRLKYGNAPFYYANIWLDDMYDIMIKNKLDYIWFASRIWETYFHEFFHLYFFRRLEYKDMIGYKIRSKSWGWNERIIKILANIFGALFIEMMNANEANYWCELFKDVK